MCVGFFMSLWIIIVVVCLVLIVCIGLSCCDGMIIGVVISGIWMLVNVMWLDSVLEVIMLVNVFSVVLVGRYELYLGLWVCMLVLEMLMMWLNWCLC